MSVTLTRLRSGLYRVAGEVCACGGELRIEATGKRGEFRWEAFCSDCKTSDPNGWPTLAKAQENLGYFTEVAQLLTLPVLEFELVKVEASESRLPEPTHSAPTGASFVSGIRRPFPRA